MNKKIFIGLSALAFAGTFFACGDGEVLTIESLDESMAEAYGVGADRGGDSTLLKDAISACKSDPECAAKMGSTVAASSSSSAMVIPLVSSSSAGVAPGQTVSSSSVDVPSFRSSSSATPAASSGSTVASSGSVASASSGDIGTCAPVTNPITKGESTSWKFTFNGQNSDGLKATDIIGYTFDWNFGTAAASQTITGLTPTTAITYTASGVAKASVSLSKAGLSNYTIQCTDLQVNGAAITGCLCEPTAASVDVADGGVAGWTVSGCSSTGANITTYTWTGATGAGESASYTFTEKGQTLAPTVNVANDDNTVQTVTCGEVKAIDSRVPDYAMATSNDSLVFTSDVDITISMTLPDTWHGSATGNGKFVCSVTRGSGNGAISGSVDGVTISGADYVAVEIPVTSTIGGYSLPLVLSIGTNEKVVCKVGW